jgi:hypothetical protein
MSPIPRQCVSNGKEYTLLDQKTHGEIRIVDPWEVTGKESFLKTLEAGHDRNDCPSPAKILAVYTSEKAIKVSCLHNLLKGIIDFQCPGLDYKIDGYPLKTSASEDKVGKQPFWPNGQLGNLYRIEEARGIVLEDPKVELKDYFAVFILSIESDIDDKRGVPGAVPYDQPNMMIYECFSGHYVSGVGRGPGVQEDILAIVKGDGFLDEDGPKLAGKVEYGKYLADLFSTKDDKIDSGDWHCKVSDYPRAHHFQELSGEISKVAKDKLLNGEIHFNLPCKSNLLA